MGLLEEYMDKFDKLTDQEIIEKFNNQIGNHGWGSARANYLGAIRQQYEKRNIDFSEIGDDKGMFYSNKVELNGKKLIIVK
ncbi:hypothetical protein [Mangrovimonas sp. ST2L15]|uniref:hypothetical protein n=1 Tax=Mangrovimonas sp. ST2L15 TaxID=1645916 RepID=UPI0006B509F3|nr:hypothetical protein [Mangrovimonas sp. ST2L15]